MSTIFVGPPSRAIALKSIDQIFVVYDRRSGLTCFLDILAGSILQALLDNRRPLDELSRYVAPLLQVAADDIPLERLEQSCRDLMGQGLIDQERHRPFYQCGGADA